MPAKLMERTRLRMGAVLVKVVVAMLSLETLAQGQNIDKAARQRAAVVILNRGGCGSCHVVPGIAGADGTVGPDLSRLGVVAAMRRSGVSAKDYIRESIIDPDAFIALAAANGDEYSAGVMPAQFAKTLSEEDLAILSGHTD